MKLSQLIEVLPFLEKRSFADVEITGIVSHSGEVRPDNLFVAIVGTQADGHQFIDQAIKNGAAALIVEQDISAPSNLPVFQVKNTRAALSRLAAHWYGYPSREMEIIGVTGTNGKTTICCLLEFLLSQAGRQVGRIGTIGIQYAGQHRKLLHTTPESTEIQQILREMADAGIKTVVMEVSSHAIDMNRADDIQFDQAIFTNLTPEHLDYHISMELYFESKKRLFTQLLPKGKGEKRAILNADDPFGQKLIEALAGQKVWTYSTKAQSKWDFFVQEWHSSLTGLEAVLNTPQGSGKFHSPLIGAFNLSNIVAAVAGAQGTGVSLKNTLSELEYFTQVSGRLERITNSKGVHVFVDYAHTPDALKNVLFALRELDPPKLITVFGCGGDRDRSKRPIMGREAALFSDELIVTSDNPRTEDPNQIIQDILPGIEEGGMTIGKKCQVEPDRKKAIEMALAMAQKNEVVLIAGKGHEDYQILGKQRVHFDDREVAREYFKK